MIVLTVLLPHAAQADVVPPAAIQVAEAWLDLVDRGRGDEAIRRFAEPDVSAELRRRWSKSSPRTKVARRTIRSWGGSGDGDSSRMPPGSYFSLVFDTIDARGANGVDEVRLRPDGKGGWRVVDARREP